MKKQITLFTALLAFAACDTVKETTSASTTATQTAEASSQVKNQTIDLDYLDRSIRPQDDFFQFSNGTWVKNNPVPPSESRWGSFNELDEANKKKLTSILEEFAKQTDKKKGSLQQILGDYYSSFINMEIRDKKGLTPIREQIDMVATITSKPELPELTARLHEYGIGSFFRFGVSQDLKNVEQHIAGFSQGGLGLPNRDYYFDESKKDILEKYQVHVKEMLVLTGTQEANAEKMAEQIVGFETSMAKHMMTRTELRSPEKTYNKITVADLEKFSEHFDFFAYTQATGIEGFDELIIGQPEYFKEFNSLIEKSDLETIKSYLHWKVIDEYAGHLDSKLVEKNFEFGGKVLSGKAEMKPLNERAIEEITRQEFGELLGKAFVGRHYSESAKERVNKMVDDLLAVYEERIRNLDWMNEGTKQEALHKLLAIGRKLGYPDKWEDFSSLNFSADNYIQNINEASRYSRMKNLMKLNQPVDKDEWGMPAHMVNAYYHPLLNEIAFPAGIMQEPFFSENYEDALNYARIGMVIGHEFTHGFDDKGSKFAADGSFTNWWSVEDRKAFEERTDKLGQTFASFCPVEGHCVNPDLTMGENIADLGGIIMAYHAYMRTDEFKANEIREGFTPSQRFFIAFAQLWKINYTEEELKNRISNDPHSPGMYRVNGPLMNCPEFFEAFDVKEGEPMRKSKDKIAKIW